MGDFSGLRFFGDTQYKTYLGGASSLLFLFFSFIVYVYYYAIFIQRDICTIVYNNISEIKPLPIIFNQTTILSLASSLNNSLVFRPDIFNISVNYIIFN